MMTEAVFTTIAQIIFLAFCITLAYWMFRQFKGVKAKEAPSRIKQFAWFLGSLIFGLWAVLLILSFCSQILV